MNYKRLYEQIIYNRKENPVAGYTECHHIIPKCLGGSDEVSNLVDLTAREHFIVHYLLSKMYTEGTDPWYKMNHAFMMMRCTSENQSRYFNSILYEKTKRNFSIVMSKNQTGDKNSQFGTRWVYNLELRKSKKIGKLDPLPDNWEEGRKVKFVDRECLCCGNSFVLKNKETTCSESCRLKIRKAKNPVFALEKEFLCAYNRHGSMNKALKELGFPGAISHWHRAAKEILEKQNKN